MTTQSISTPSAPVLQSRPRALGLFLYFAFIVGMVVALAWALLERDAARAIPHTDALWRDFVFVVITSPFVVLVLAALRAVVTVAVVLALRIPPFGGGLVGWRGTVAARTAPAVSAVVIAATLLRGAPLHEGLRVMIVGVSLHQLVYGLWQAERLAAAVAVALDDAATGDSTAALAYAEKALASPGMSAADRVYALGPYAGYLNDAGRYAESLDAMAELGRAGPLEHDVRACWADSLLSAHVSGQRAAGPAELAEARAVVHAALQSAPSAAIEHSAALAALADGDHHAALRYARSALRGLEQIAVSPGQQSHVRTVRAAEAIACWHTGDQERASQILGELRAQDPAGVWTRSLERLVHDA